MNTILFVKSKKKEKRIEINEIEIKKLNLRIIELRRWIKKLNNMKKKLKKKMLYILPNEFFFL